MAKEDKSIYETTLLWKDVYDIRQHLTEVGHLAPTDAKTARFGYAVERNLDKCKPLIKAIEKAVGSADKAFQKYQTDRYNIAVNCGAIERSNPDGGKSASGVTDTKRYAEELESLNKKNAKVINAEQDRQYQASDLLKEELTEEVSWHKADYKNIPSHVTSGQRANLMFMLNEPTDADFDEMNFSETKDDKE